MNRLRISIAEIKLYWRHASRSYFWIIIALGFTFLSILEVYSLTTSYRFDIYPLKWDFFSVLEGSMNYWLIFIVSASLLISEEREDATWDIMRSMKASKGALLAGKFIWLQLFSLILLIVSYAVTAVFLLSNAITFSWADVPPLVSILLSFWALTALFNVFGLLFSSMFSKKITSVVAVIATWILLSVIGAGIMSSSYVESFFTPTTPGPTGLPLIFKIGILLDPYYFVGMVADLNSLYLIDVPVGPNNGVQLSTPVLFFSPGFGYIWIFMAFILVCTFLIYILLRVKDQWGVFGGQ
ncbi:ABC-type transport system involved in multi-copper enzyme maturation, permease component [Thermoplasmatales archaeon]|nr:ABC-type transport system involved in multi-copper enzyme maturation, permease component [Thermoplasmatales archaeon]